MYVYIIEDENVREEVLRIFFKNYLKLIEPYSEIYSYEGLGYITLYFSNKFNGQMSYKLKIYSAIINSLGIMKYIGIKAFIKGVKTLFKMSSTWIESITDGEYVHIDMVAFDELMRGRGFFRKLIEEVYKMHPKNTLFTLETHNEINVGIYEKFGFYIVDKILIEESNLIQYCMVRKWHKIIM